MRGEVVRVWERGGVAERNGACCDCCSYWLEPEGAVLLSPCDACRRFQSECMLVARPTNVLNIHY